MTNLIISHVSGMVTWLHLVATITSMSNQLTHLSSLIILPWIHNLEHIAKPLLEQFRISGGEGGDELGFVAGSSAVDVDGLSEKSNDWVGVIDGGPGDDILMGSDARDRLDGGGGSDMLYGFGGDDRLWGDTGGNSGGSDELDVLFAGTGNDDFFFGNNWGDDSIGDFDVEHDQLYFQGVVGLNAEAQLNLTDTADGLEIEFDGDTILLTGVSSWQLDQDSIVL